MFDIATAKEVLKRHGQEHVLKFYDELDDEHRKLLLRQIEGLDFDMLDGFIEQYVLNPKPLEIPTKLDPPEVVPAVCGRADEATIALHAEAKTRGEELLAAGKVAAFTVAGGQGTRLGYEGPKGCFDVTPVVKKSLFRVFAEQIRAAAIRCGETIPWYILTSPVNDIPTQAYFRQNDFWGFDPKDVIFVQQGTLPAIGFDGKLLLARKYRLAVSPDGHGGSLTALRRSGALDDMKSRGIEVISYFQVDNPIVRAIDPVFIGLHSLQSAEMSAKCVAKCDPLEKVGNFCVVDGKVCVIEYSDLPDELAMACNDDGRLKFSAGSIAIHVFSRDFVERLTDGGLCQLPIHRAEKKVPHIDITTGEQVLPPAPNAVKLEMFVFDAMQLAKNTVILETLREEEFSPVKNAEGTDSLVTSLHDQIRRAAGWLERAGVPVPRDANGQVAAALEISPLFADSEESLTEKADPSISITPGQNFYLGSKGQIGGA
ncbi:MAG: UDPGP type 1 family protein [Phycisphaerae bacterium]|nr:UDPGP type 1 family protein [Phycisphaerae bacterium]